MLKTRTRQIVVIGILVVLVIAIFIPVNHRVDAKAQVVPLSSAKVRALSGGFLREVFVGAGDRVSKGQMLARLDDESLRMRLRIAENHVETLQIRLARVSGTEAPGVLARLRLDLDTATEEVTSLKERVASFELYSPIDGVVLTESLGTKVGDYIARGREVLEILEPRAMRVSVTLQQQDMRSVSVGDAVDVYLAAFGRERFVSRVARVITINDTGAGGPGAPAPQGFHAYIDLSNPGAGVGESGETATTSLGRLRPGMTGTASIIVGTRTLGAHVVASLRSILKTELLFF